jgi:hypothetical protein
MELVRVLPEVIRSDPALVYPEKEPLLGRFGPSSTYSLRGFRQRSTQRAAGTGRGLPSVRLPQRPKLPRKPTRRAQRQGPK